MQFKNWSLVILMITAFACSRSVFAAINDPEGPNLLIVSVLAVVLFLPSSAAYLSTFRPSLAGFKRISAAVLVQIIFATCICAVLITGIV